MKLSEIMIRDPFILKSNITKEYYLYGTTNEKELGFYAYKSKDLENWEGPFKVFTPPSDFWGKRDFWAPEVYELDNKYYLIGTFKGDDHHRSCQILKADSPLGPFKIYSKEVTPIDWESLDGTLYFYNNKPYLIFVHEWTQIDDGEMCIVELSEDLKEAIGKPRTLFKGSEANWAKVPNWANKNIHVVDGPFVYKYKGDEYLLWSSFYKKGYNIGLTKPSKNILNSKLVHSNEPLPLIDSGHGMIFDDFNNNHFLVVHAENSKNNLTHPIIVPINFIDNKIELEDK